MTREEGRDGPTSLRGAAAWRWSRPGRSGPDKVSLSLAIVGVGGERCTNLTVNGKRPPKPLFVIKDKDGKMVHQGSFEYG